jgi:hypothetical protein
MFSFKEADTATGILGGRYRTAAAFDYTQQAEWAASDTPAVANEEVHAATLCLRLLH